MWKARSGRPKTVCSETKLPGIEVNLMNSTRSVSGEFRISQGSVVCYLHNLKVEEVLDQARSGRPKTELRISQGSVVCYLHNLSKKHPELRNYFICYLNITNLWTQSGIMFVQTHLSKRLTITAIIFVISRFAEKDKQSKCMWMILRFLLKNEKELETIRIFNNDIGK